MALPWEAHKDLLKKLWLDQDMSYEQVRAMMGQDHNFIASKNQYVVQFKKWEWKKNITSKEWKLISRSLKVRKEAGKNTAVYLNNRRIPDATVRKELSRHVALVPLSPQMTNHCLLDRHLQVRTPPSMLLNRAPLSNEGSSHSHVHRKTLAPHELMRSSAIDLLQQTKLPPDFMSTTTNTSTKAPSNQKRKLSHGPAFPAPKRQRAIDSMQVHTNNPNKIIPTLRQPVATDNLPYLDFLKIFRSLEPDKSFKTESSIKVAQYPIRFENQIRTNTVEFDVMEAISNSQDPVQFYRFFAISLLAQDNYEKKFQLDTNMNLPQLLPQILENLPETHSWERKDIVENILGSSRAQTTLNLLEIVAYLFSNNLISLHFNHANYESPILGWIVQNVSFEMISSMLKPKLLTMMAFQTALFGYGIHNGHLHFTRAMLDLDTGLREVICSSDRSLQKALLSRVPEMVEIILGICPNHLHNLDLRFMYEIAAAREKPSVRIAEYLIQWGALEKREVMLSVLLCDAIRLDNLALARYLVGFKVGDDPVQGKNPYANCTALGEAIQARNIYIFHLLLQQNMSTHTESMYHARSKFLRGLRVPALHLAVAGRNIEMIRPLLKAGADINRYSSLGTPLYIAVKSKHLRMVKTLLENGASYTNEDLYDSSAILRAAITTGNLAILRTLLKHGASFCGSMTSEFTENHIKFAFKNGASDEVVALLMEAGAVVQTTSDQNMLIKDWKMLQLVRFMLEDDIDNALKILDRIETLDMRPIRDSRSTWSGTVRPYNNIVTKKSVCHWAILSQGVDEELFRELIHRIKDINDTSNDESMEPPLHAAAWQGRLDFVEVLLQSGADINKTSTLVQVKDMPGAESQTSLSLLTALQIAAYKQNIGLLSLLLEKGAEINPILSAASTTTFTTLQIFIEGLIVTLASNHSTATASSALTIGNSEHSSYELFEFLLRSGADVNASPTSCAPSPLQRLCSLGNNRKTLVMARRLVQLGAEVNTDFDHNKWPMVPPVLPSSAASGDSDLVTFY